MRWAVIGACVLMGALGCVPQARFLSVACAPETDEDDLTGVSFRSSFETLHMDQQQLLCEVAVLDPQARPVRSETGRYKDRSGNLTAMRTVMVLQNPSRFENVQMSIPAAELSAANRQRPAFAEFRIATPDGKMLASQRVALPAPYAANVPTAPPPVAAAPERDTRMASARPRPSAAPRASSSSAPPRDGQQPATRRSAPPPRETAADGRSTESPDAAARSGRGGTADAAASPAGRVRQSEQGKPVRKGEPPPLRPVAGSGARETPPRPTATTTRPAEPRGRMMAGDRNNQPVDVADSRPSKPTSTRPAASQPSTSRPSRPTRESELDREDGGAEESASRRRPPASRPADEP